MFCTIYSFLVKNVSSSEETKIVNGKQVLGILVTHCEFMVHIGYLERWGICVRGREASSILSVSPKVAMAMMGRMLGTTYEMNIVNEKPFAALLVRPRLYPGRTEVRTSTSSVPAEMRRGDTKGERRYPNQQARSWDRSWGCGCATE